ncbi:IS3 family transposase [Arthrobacter rhombi]|uniref:IS3 family transposase n=1 Tax=Arthrobacter rhombi TaxID=71253 RepID=UPI003FCF0A76
MLLQIAALSLSAFYDHRRQLHQEDPRVGIKVAIREAFSAGKIAYEHRRIRAMLLRQGGQCLSMTVLKPMRQLGLRCPVRRRKRYNSFRGEIGEAADSVLNRQFDTDSRHTKWFTDVTEIIVGAGKVSLLSLICMTTCSSQPPQGLLRASIRTLTASKRRSARSDRTRNFSSILNSACSIATASG